MQQIKWSSEELYKRKNVYRQKREGTKKTKWVALLIARFLQKKAGVYQADYLTSVDQAIPGGLV